MTKTVEVVQKVLHSMSEQEIAMAVMRIHPQGDPQLAEIFMRELNTRNQESALRLCYDWYNGLPYTTSDGVVVEPQYL